LRTGSISRQNTGRTLQPAVQSIGQATTLKDHKQTLKARRNKKNATAAQLQGKVTGRWTEEEHQRFLEGKQEFKSFHIRLLYSIGLLITSLIKITVIRWLTLPTFSYLADRTNPCLQIYWAVPT